MQRPSLTTNWRQGLTMSTAGEEGEPPSVPPVAAISAGLLGLYGTVATFDLKEDDWCEYIERLEHYFSANDIASPEKRRTILLTTVGASTYSLISTLVSPAKVSEVLFADIIDRAKAHFNLKPSPIEYLQVPLDEASCRLTTINRHKGLFKYTRLPFGIASAPSVFQRIMENLLQGIPRVCVYLDDIW